MRLKLVLPATLLCFAVVAVLWARERRAGRALETRLTALRAEHRDLEALQARRQQLRTQVSGGGDLAALRSATAERDRLRREIAAREASAQASAGPLALGEPKPWRSWRNQGRATPRAAVETTLWAAAGGDTHAFASLLEIEPAVREKATQLLAQLPAGVRGAYPDPDALIASVSMKNIPLATAQIAWMHETDSDHVNLALVLLDPERTASPRVATPPAPGDVLPPALPDAQASKLTFLSLHRTESGWRVLVPEAAVDRVAQELGGP